eukprot:1753027-Rhodomonas_salina.1
MSQAGVDDCAAGIISATSLRACYAISGTDIGCATTRQCRESGKLRYAVLSICLRACYGMVGTEIA